MILRAAIVFLLVLNLGVAAWWGAGGNIPPRVPAAKPPAGTPTLRLASERNADAPRVPAGPQAPAVAPAVPEPAPSAAEPNKPIASCLRFGPFADEAARTAAAAALSAAGIDATARDTAARSGRGWKVHLPPFATREEAVAMGERIKAAGIRDWYVMNGGADANSIALGRYGGEEAARRREAELRAKGIPAQAEALGSTPAQAWLDARLPANADRASIASIAPSKPIECAAAR